jgi:transcription elongation factor GreA
MGTNAATVPRHAVPITREGRRLLRDRLAALTTVGRAEASARVRDARGDGADPVENPELMQALQAQEQLERRIAEVESQLARAQLLEGPNGSGEVGIGTRVRIRRRGTPGRAQEYRIVSSVEADPGRGMLSIESPVGAALVGRRAGDTVQVEAPAGVAAFELVAVDNGSTARRGTEPRSRSAPAGAEPIAA